MNHLVRLTSSNYRDYRRSMNKVEYSFANKNGTQNLLNAKIATEFSRDYILGKGEFLDMIEKPEVEMYVFRNDAEENIGIVILTFSKRSCNIHDFAVFEKGKGLGTELYEEIKKIIISKSKEITLFCPFEGAQEFWKTMGFFQIPKKQFYFKSIL